MPDNSSCGSATLDTDGNLLSKERVRPPLGSVIAPLHDNQPEHNKQYGYTLAVEP
jgi:hypothetical protein